MDSDRSLGYRDKMQPVSFRQSIQPGKSGTLEYTVNAPGTVEEVYVRFYTGQQLALQVDVYVEHTGERREELIQYAGGSRSFLSGDDDRFTFPCAAAVDQYDRIVVWYNNTDATNSYDVIVDVIIDYYGGLNRVV